MRNMLLFLLAGVAGCSSHRPALVLEMNGHRFEFERFTSGRIPRGMEVARFDQESIQVVGEGIIEVNGLNIQAQKDYFTIGDRKLSLEPDAEVTISKNNEIQIRLPSSVTGGPGTQRVQSVGPLLPPPTPVKP